MATIDDLNYKSISEMTSDEAIEELRKIRLSRRTGAKKIIADRSAAKASARAISKKLPPINANQAKSLLQKLGELDNDD